MEALSLTALEVESLRLSLWVSGWAVAAACCALAMKPEVSPRQIPGICSQALVCLPLVLPPVVTGYTLLVLMGKNELWPRPQTAP